MLRYTWFVPAEVVPKNMNESLADTVLASLDADSVLRATQTLLQKMKIALDRIASDLNSADGGGDMVDNFLQSRDFVNGVLYEIARTMTEFQVISGAQESCWGISVKPLYILIFRSLHNPLCLVISCQHQ